MDNKDENKKELYICPAGGRKINAYIKVTKRGVELKVYFNSYACLDCKV